MTEYDASPKYLQIQQILVRWLKTVEVGAKLPTEQELVAKFNVSRMTVRQALNALEANGTIARRPGYGTWLARPVDASGDDRVTGPIEEVARFTGQTSTVLIGSDVVDADDALRETLKLGHRTRAWLVERLRLWDGAPLLLLQAYFPVTIGRAINWRTQGDHLMVPMLRERFDPLIHEADQRIEATVAEPAAARHLGIAPGAPILEINRTFLDAKARPVVYFRTRYRADRYYHTVKLPRPKLDV